MEIKHVRVGDKDTQQRIKKQLDKVPVGYAQRILPVETHGGVLVYSRSEWFSWRRDTLYVFLLTFTVCGAAAAAAGGRQPSEQK